MTKNFFPPESNRKILKKVLKIPNIDNCILSSKLCTYFLATLYICFAIYILFFLMIIVTSNTIKYIALKEHIFHLNFVKKSVLVFD